MLIWALWAGLGRAQPVTGPVRAGADARPLCTLSGVPLAGFGGVQRRKTIPWLDGYTFFFSPDEGIHDGVRVKTLVLEVQSTPPQRIAFIALDVIGASANVALEVASRMGGTGLTRENMIFLGSHTHSGPGAASDKIFWQIAAVDRLHSEVFNHLVGAIVDSLTASLARLEPARVGTGVGYAPLISENRRHDGAPVDARVGVIKVEATGDGSPLAVLFNFAVHGTCLGGSNMLVSADNMGYAERYLEAEIPGVVALFANAAEADVKPAQGGFAGAEYVGESLGVEVADIWGWTDTDPEATLEIVSSLETLPPLSFNVAACDDTLQSLLGTFLIGAPDELAETEELFVAVRLNDTAMITIPGEALTEIGFTIQDAIEVQGFDPVLILGLANGYMGYILTPDEYDLGGYEACGTLHGRNTGDFVTDRAIAMGLALTPPSDEPDAGADAGTDSGVAPDAGQTADASPPTADAAGPPPPAPDKGCSCHATPGPAPLSLALLLLGLLWRRRRR